MNQDLYRKYLEFGVDRLVTIIDSDDDYTNEAKEIAAEVIKNKQISNTELVEATKRLWKEWVDTNFK